MLGYGILIAGAVLFWASLTGKASAVLAALKTDLSSFNASTDTSLGNMPVSNNSEKPYTVNLDGGGSVTVNANSPDAALQNVQVETGQTGTVAG